MESFLWLSVVLECLTDDVIITKIAQVLLGFRICFKILFTFSSSLCVSNIVLILFLKGFGVDLSACIGLVEIVTALE